MKVEKKLLCPKCRKTIGSFTCEKDVTSVRINCPYCNGIFIVDVTEKQKGSRVTSSGSRFN